MPLIVERAGRVGTEQLFTAQDGLNYNHYGHKIFIVPDREKGGFTILIDGPLGMWMRWPLRFSEDERGVTKKRGILRFTFIKDIEVEVEGV